MNLILWSCRLEHILAYPIVLLYFFIIKTSEALYKTHFGSNIHHYKTIEKHTQREQEGQGNPLP
jgi:hypothetical protein